MGHSCTVMSTDRFKKNRLNVVFIDCYLKNPIPGRVWPLAGDMMWRLPSNMGFYCAFFCNILWRRQHPFLFIISYYVVNPEMCFTIIGSFASLAESTMASFYVNCICWVSNLVLLSRLLKAGFVAKDETNLSPSFVSISLSIDDKTL